MAAKFNPNKSKVSDARLADFIQAPLTGDLNEVPGIGPATVELLKKEGISTTFQLIGKYLSLKDEGVGPIEHADRFFYWLASIGTPAGFRSGIVHSIAEKMNITFVGIYDATAYDDAEDA
eukprot:gene34030-41189_t